MPIKVTKVADIVDGRVFIIGGKLGKRVSGILTAYRTPPGSSAEAAAPMGLLAPNMPTPAVSDPKMDLAWELQWSIGTGLSERTIGIPIERPMPEDVSEDQPYFFADDRLIYFRAQLFVPSWPPRTPEEREEASLRVKKEIYDQDAELNKLKASVANMEAALSYKEGGSRRTPIPNDVKLLVWARDGGKCVKCGSDQNLQFDHIIPVVKGGGNSADNIQILCQTCNLRKSGNLV